MGVGPYFLRMKKGRIHIRREQSKDIEAVRRVNLDAFPSEAEANLVDALRDAADCISLVAETENAIVGHILFSPMQLRGNGSPVLLAGLAPMAVLTSHQKQGIGSALVNAGVAACKEAGVGLIAVLGHPGYYPRFGFSIAATHGLQSPYDVPPEVFMVQALRPGVLEEISGTLEYHPCFDNLG